MNTYNKLNEEICLPLTPENLEQVLERIQKWKECKTCKGFGSTDSGKACPNCKSIPGDWHKEDQECEECGGMGHTIGFLGKTKQKYPCETC